MLSLGQWTPEAFGRLRWRGAENHVLPTGPRSARFPAGCPLLDFIERTGLLARMTPDAFGAPLARRPERRRRSEKPRVHTDCRFTAQWLPQIGTTDRNAPCFGLPIAN